MDSLTDSARNDLKCTTILREMYKSSLSTINVFIVAVIMYFEIPNRKIDKKLG